MGVSRFCNEVFWLRKVSIVRKNLFRFVTTDCVLIATALTEN